MNPDIFELGRYAYNPFAIPPLFVALTVLIVGALIAMRERISRATIALGAAALCIFCWMLGTALTYLATDPDLALQWAKLAVAGTIVLPAAAQLFAAVIANKHDRLKKRIVAVFVISAGFLAALVLSPLYITGVASRPWGYYPVYGPVGAAYVVFFLCVHAATLALLWVFYKQALPGSSARRHAGLVLAAIGIASFASVDLLAALDVEVYPFGFLFILAFFAIVSHVVRRFHFVEITPALAGQTIVDTINEALVVVNEEGVIRLVNPAACELMGRMEDELLGSRFSDNFTAWGSEHIHEALLAGKPIRSIETAYQTRQGTMRTVSVSASALRDRKNRPIALIYVLRDITKRKHAEDRIRFLAYHDVLTKLPNRTQFDERVTQTLSLTAGSEDSIAVLFIDLDRFKNINDTFGHHAGDRLLVAAANRLRKCLRAHDPADDDRHADRLIARLGGDEFAVALTGVYRVQDLRGIAQRIIDRLSEPFTLQGEKAYIGASVGISMAPRDGTDAGILLKNADRAMYHAKQAGRGNYHFYNSDMDAVTAERIQLETDLRHALERAEFQLAYQPQVNLQAGTMIGAEALLRWKHPRRGVLPPTTFIPVLEESGAICEVGRWVLQEACHQAKRWEREGLGSFKIAVNISPRQFRHGDLVQDVVEALRKAELDPRWLELEVTENLLMRDADQTVSNLTELKTMGVSIAVDDFGTGYSSLRYLRRFPIDVIKMDRAFVQDIAAGLRDAAVTNTIIALAHNLNRGLVAEGVETRQQAELLHEKGCHLMQGYLFGKPMPAERFTAMLRAEGAADRPIDIRRLGSRSVRKLGTH